MNIKGLKVDTAALGRGFYRIIREQKMEAIVAFGMLPAEIMATIEKLLREKIVAEAAKQSECTPAELAPFVSKPLVDEIVRPIMHEICLAIYAEAKAAGMMVV